MYLFQDKGYIALPSRYCATSKIMPSHELNILLQNIYSWLKITAFLCPWRQFVFFSAFTKQHKCLIRITKYLDTMKSINFTECVTSWLCSNIFL